MTTTIGRHNMGGSGGQPPKKCCEIIVYKESFRVKTNCFYCRHLARKNVALSRKLLKLMHVYGPAMYTAMYNACIHVFCVLDVYVISCLNF